jgi:hypothetical protein
MLGSLAHTTVPFSDVVLYLGLYLYLQLSEKRIGGVRLDTVKAKAIFNISDIKYFLLDKEKLLEYTTIDSCVIRLRY